MQLEGVSTNGENAIDFIEAEFFGQWPLMRYLLVRRTTSLYCASAVTVLCKCEISPLRQRPAHAKAPAAGRTPTLPPEVVDVAADAGLLGIEAVVV
jgi:hypothetical protein